MLDEFVAASCLAEARYRRDGMEWNGMERNGMEWNGMERNGMERNGMEWNGMEWNGMEWNGVEWNGMEWNGIEWIRMEWNGMECGHRAHLAEARDARLAAEEHPARRVRLAPALPAPVVRARERLQRRALAAAGVGGARGAHERARHLLLDVAVVVRDVVRAFAARARDDAGKVRAARAPAKPRLDARADGKQRGRGAFGRGLGGGRLELRDAFGVHRHRAKLTAAFRDRRSTELRA